MFLKNEPERCPRQTLRADTVSNFEAEKENEGGEDDGEDESLQSVSCDQSGALQRRIPLGQ